MEGYAKIASFMGKHPESAQVLCFSDINLQNILYLQAEIYGLREDLRNIEAQSQTSSSETFKSFALDWYTLSSTPDNDGGMNRQWQKVLQLRKLLKEYSIDSVSCCLIWLVEKPLRLTRTTRWNSVTISPDVKVVAPKRPWFGRATRMAAKTNFRSHLSYGPWPRGMVSRGWPCVNRKQATFESIDELDCQFPSPDTS